MICYYHHHCCPAACCSVALFWLGDDSNSALPTTYWVGTWWSVIPAGSQDVHNLISSGDCLNTKHTQHLPLREVCKQLIWIALLVTTLSNTWFSVVGEWSLSSSWMCDFDDGCWSLACLGDSSNTRCRWIIIFISCFIVFNASIISMKNEDDRPHQKIGSKNTFCSH